MFTAFGYLETDQEDEKVLAAVARCLKGASGALVLDLQDLLGVKVDVVSEDGLYWILRRRILKEAKPL